MTLPVNEIICGDCLEVLPKLPKAKMIFADPPDSLGVKYKGFRDCIARYETEWLPKVIRAGCREADIFWLSCSPRYISSVWPVGFEEMRSVRLFIWRYTFGQHNNNDCGQGYRPLFRLWSYDAIFYPNAIRVPSKRQTLYNDKRANPKGRVPDDVWEFSRVCGTFKEKRQWHPNQHPEALIERIIKFSYVPGDLVIDMFAGTGTVNRVCKRLGIGCIGIEISPFYCEKISEETGAESRPDGIGV